MPSPTPPPPPPHPPPPPRALSERGSTDRITAKRGWNSHGNQHPSPISTTVHYISKTRHISITECYAVVVPRHGGILGAYAVSLKPPPSLAVPIRLRHIYVQLGVCLRHDSRA